MPACKHQALKSVSFNTDLSCIVCAFVQCGSSRGGYGVFSTSIFSRLAWREFSCGGFNHAEMFGHTNVLLLVGGTVAPPGFSDRSVTLYNDANEERMWEIRLPAPIIAVQCRRDLLVAVLENKVVTYRIGPNFSNISYEFSESTALNPAGICALSANESTSQVTIHEIEMCVFRNSLISIEWLSCSRKLGQMTVLSFLESNTAVIES